MLSGVSTFGSESVPVVSVTDAPYEARSGGHTTLHSLRIGDLNIPTHRFEANTGMI